MVEQFTVGIQRLFEPFFKHMQESFGSDDVSGSKFFDFGDCGELLFKVVSSVQFFRGRLEPMVDKFPVVEDIDGILSR